MQVVSLLKVGTTVFKEHTAFIFKVDIGAYVLDYKCTFWAMVP